MVVVERDGGTVAKMDDSGGDDLDSSLHWHQFRFLDVLVGFEIGSRDISGAAQLPRRRFRSRQGFRLVLGARAFVFPSLDGSLRCGDNGIRWVWCSVARHH